MELNLLHNSPEDNSPNYQIVNNRTCTLLCSEEEKVKIASKCGIRKFGVRIQGKLSSLALDFTKLTKELHNVVNKQYITELSFTNNGNIILETENVECAISALKITQLCGVEVETRAIEDFLLTKHILRDLDVGVSLTEIFEQLHEDNILCLRITRFTKPNSPKPIPTILVCEFGKVTRDSARIFGINFCLCPFKEQPRICQNCLGYGHSFLHCRNSTKCPKCGAEHKLQNCKQSSTICFRCGKKHLASSKLCEAYKTEAKAYAVAKAECIDVQEARKIVENMEEFAEKFGQYQDSICQLQLEMDKIENKIKNIIDQLSELQDALLNTFQRVWGIRNRRIRREG